MATGRPDIPRPLERDIKVEAGHRCAIPTCRATVGLQIHHIVPWSKVQKHEFHNLIYICANCHSRVTNGEIDTKAMKQYKANLSVVASRYGTLERRVLETFARHPDKDIVELPVGNGVHLSYLVNDGLLERHEFFDTSEALIQSTVENWRLTTAGRDFVKKWIAAEDIE